MADDQNSFNKFLRFAWSAAQKYGCRGQATADAPCAQPVKLVPWMVNENGVPFMTTGTGAMDGNGSVNYSNGSAADADFQIAWAIHLAAQNKDWQQHMPEDLNYADILKTMLWDIGKFDINLENNLYLPGASWFEEGEKTYFPGYYTPQSFDIFAQYAQGFPAQNEAQLIASSDIQISINNATAKIASVHETSSSTGTWSKMPHDATAYTTDSYTFTPKNNDAQGAWMYVGWGQYDAQSATHLCTATFQYDHINQTWHSVDPQLEQCELKKTSHNVFTFTMYDPAVTDWLAVKKDNLMQIVKFQQQYTALSGLMPNIADPHTLTTKYNDHYGYDATRYPLWTGAYLLTYCNETTADFCVELSASLDQLLQYFIAQGVIAAGSLPVNGYYYGPQSAAYSATELAGPALNGPVLVAAHALNQIDLYNALLPIPIANENAKFPSLRAKRGNPGLKI